jgi:hypothetical protein
MSMGQRFALPASGGSPNFTDYDPSPLPLPRTRRSTGWESPPQRGN